MLKKIALISLIFISSPAVAVESAATECWYFAQNATEEQHEQHCINIEGNLDSSLGDARIKPQILTALHLTGEELATVRSKGGFFYVNAAGIMRKAFTFDNGADYFSEGLARTQSNGKIGFFDRTLKIIIPPHYDFAFPFSNGAAVVCNGCIEQAEGEHKRRVGGLWGTINRQGAIVQQLKEVETSPPSAEKKP